MQDLIDFLKDFNVQNLISIVVVIWYFTRDIKKEIQNLDRDVRILNTRLSRLEGTTYGNKVYQEIPPNE